MKQVPAPGEYIVVRQHGKQRMLIGRGYATLADAQAAVADDQHCLADTLSGLVMPEKVAEYSYAIFKATWQQVG